MKKRWFVVLVAVVVTALLSCSVFAQTPYVTRIEKGSAPKDSLILATFNACNIGKTKMKKPGVLAAMAKMFRDVDVLAIQEVSTSDAGAFAVAMLADELNRTGAAWDYAISDPTTGPGTERFAFFWKKSKVEAIPRSAPLCKSVENVLDREPAKMAFRVGQKKFSIYSFHLVPTDKNPELEVAKIGQFSAEFMSGPAVFVGDFNLSYREMANVFEGMLHTRHQIEGKTSLKSKIDGKGSYLQKEYDNIFTRGFRVYQAGILDFVAGGDLKEARKISDHLPAFIVFSVE